MAQQVTLDLPETVYERLKRTAEALGCPLEEVVLQALELSLPPLGEELPPELREEAARMVRLDEPALRQIARSTLPPGQQRTLSRLLRKQQAGTLSEAEQKRLEALVQEADRLMLRKALAYALLKWRGHPLPPAPPPKPSRPEA